jgi:transposase
MIQVAGGVRVYLALGRTDMRKGMNGLSMLVQEVLGKDVFTGHRFVFRGRRGDLIKILCRDGQGFCLFAKRLERGRFVTIHRCQYLIPVGGKQGRAGYGFIFAMNGLMAVIYRPPPFIAIALIARACIRRPF